MHSTRWDLKQWVETQLNDRNFGKLFTACSSRERFRATVSADWWVEREDCRHTRGISIIIETISLRSGGRNRGRGGGWTSFGQTDGEKSILEQESAVVGNNLADSHLSPLFLCVITTSMTCSSNPLENPGLATAHRLVVPNPGSHTILDRAARTHRYRLRRRYQTRPPPLPNSTPLVAPLSWCGVSSIARTKSLHHGTMLCRFSCYIPRSKMLEPRWKAWVPKHLETWLTSGLPIR